MNNDKNNKINVFSINRMFVFLLLSEFVNFIYSYLIDAFFISKIVLLLILIFLGTVSNFDSSDNKNTKYSFILFILYFIYLSYFVPNNDEIFSYGFYLIEISLVVIFSNFIIINKILVNYLFVLLLIVIRLFFKSVDLNFTREVVFIISFSIFTLFAILISENITSKLIYLLNQSEIKQKELELSYNFFKTILDQEKIKILYFYPNTNKAIILSSKLSDGKNLEIPDFFDYIRKNNMISLEYFGMIQNSINIIKKEGYSSIVLPISFFSKTPIWMKLSGTKVFEEESNQDKIIISVTNVNDVKNVELKFKNALKQCSISTWEYDIKNDTIYNYSDLILDYYFYGNPIQNISKTFIARNIIYYDDIKTFSDALEEVKNGKAEVSFDIRVFQNRNSYSTWVRFHFTCFKDNENNPSKAWVSVENIDDEKASEKWFEIERKKNFDDSSNLIIMGEINVSRNYVINYDAKFIDKIDKVKENSIDKIIESFLKIGIIIKDIKELYKRFSQDYLLNCYEKGERILEFNYKVITAENDIIYVSNVIKLFFDLNTKEIIAFVFFYDITEKMISKMSLDAIFLRNFVYLAYVNLLNSHMSISKTQLKDVTNSFNPNRIYKFEWEVFIEKYVHPDDKKYVYSQIDIENIREQMRYKNIFTFDYRITDGGNMITARRCFFIKATENDPIILIIEQNISQEIINRTKNEVVLKATLEKATQAANAKNEFLSRMSHEIRTPLNAIIGLSELARTDNKIDAMDYFEKINNSSTYLLGLLNDILDMNKLELGRVKLNYKAVDVKEFYNVIITIVKNQALKKNIKFEFNHQGPYYQYQIIEKLRAQQIILNVLNNAIKYTNINGIVSYNIKNIEQNGRLYTIHTISDNGVGISKDFIKNIYKPFSREKNKLSDTEGGTGLGLAICSNLIKQLNGEMNIESELNVGTKVTLKFPIMVISEEEYLSKNEEFTQNQNKSFEDKKILIAEDHQVNAMVITTILNNLGITVIHAEDGEKTVELFKNSKENEFDLILMDIMMPKIDGLIATKLIRNLNRAEAKSIPIIALSANAFDEDVKKSISFGMNNHLKKPIQMKKLLRILNKYL